MTGSSSGILQASLRGAAALVLAAVGVAIASHARLRLELDLTRTRAYTLSERTQRLLAGLDGPWSITIAAAEAGIAPAVQRQMDEVLRRFSEAAPSLRSRRIDPTDPAAIAEWERLIEEVTAAALRADSADAARSAVDGGPASAELGGGSGGSVGSVGFGGSGGSGGSATDRSTTLLDEAEREIAMLGEFARREAEALAALPSSGREEVDALLASMRTGFATYASRFGELRDSVRRLRTTSAQQPLPDDEAARLAISANHAAWTDQLTAASTTFRDLAQNAALPEALRSFSRRAWEQYEQMAQSLLRTQDRLARLPPSRLSELGRQLAAGEAAVIVGPPGVAVVPAWQLLPTEQAADPSQAAESRLRADRRFRGEQVLASAIESLLRPSPVVVLVHAEEKSMLRPDSAHNDLVVAADVLRAARLELREWMIADPPPLLPTDRPTVFVVLAPQRRSGVDIAPAERTLLERTRRLIEEGRPVLLTLGRSLRPLFRQEDPWATLCRELGVELDSGTVVLEIDRLGPGRGVTRSWQRLEPPSTEHPISAAIAGQALVLTHTMPLAPAEPRDLPGATVAEQAAILGSTIHPPMASVPAAVLALIEPGERRWLESDWRLEGQERASPPDGRGLKAPIPVVLAIEQPLARSRVQSGGGATSRQRLVLVASGGWLLTSILDLGEPLGGGRVIPANPGNRELLLASVLWLAGLDDRIAPGPGGAAAARLAGIEPRTRWIWSTIAIAGLPMAALAMGSIVVALRRRG